MLPEGEVHLQEEEEHQEPQGEGEEFQDHRGEGAGEEVHHRVREEGEEEGVGDHQLLPGEEEELHSLRGQQWVF